MKNSLLLLTFGLIVLCAAPGWAADDEAWAVFEGKKDRLVEIRLMSGQIFVTGYDGDTVHVRARSRDQVEETNIPADSDPRANGLRKLTHSATGLETWADGNVVTVATSSVGMPIELHVRVPRDVSVDIGSHFADTVSVENLGSSVRVRANGSVRLNNVDGDIEVDTQGWIYLTDITGSVVANSQFGGIEGGLSRISEDRPISLSATGPIDVALPRTAKATVHMTTSFGEVFTDFDMKVERKKSNEGAAPIPVLPPLPPMPDTQRHSKVKKSTYDEAVRAYMEADRELARAEEKQKQVEHKLQETVEAQKDAKRLLADKVADKVAMAPRDSIGTVSLVGRINGGGAEIRLISMSGNIYVRRGK